MYLLEEIKENFEMEKIFELAINSIREELKITMKDPFNRVKKNCFHVQLVFVA
jgi:hypothetical protein